MNVPTSTTKLVYICVTLEAFLCIKTLWCKDMNFQVVETKILRTSAVNK